MHRAARRLMVFAVVALAPLPAAAAGFGLFQHGGRGAAQVGALTGRADDPSALTYNPAGITRLKGGQLQAGLDFGVAEDDFRDATGSYSATHHINFPPALYLTYGPRRADSGWAVGLGLDAPFWNTNDWQPALFPRATSSRKWTVELFELHPVLAYAVDERWSFAVGFRYLRGELEDAHRTPLAAIIAPGSSFVVFGEHSSQADVDGWGYDFALHYDQPTWGWGAVLRSAAKVEGSSQSATRVEGFVPPSLADEVETSVDFLEDRPGQIEFELPPEFRIGFWGAPYPELRLELDLAFAAWSEVDNSLSRVTPPPVCLQAACPFSVERRWDDSVSVRLGFEGDVTDHAALSGGVAYEPSPVPSSQVEAGFPRGDAYVYALGWSYNFPELSFDIGYSFHDHQGRGDGFGGRYSASEQVFAFAVRWR
jgi:long-chain fatty acid transport protein